MILHILSKKTPISVGVKLCIIATITMHICTTTIACTFNILIIFYSLLFFSLFFICKTNPPFHVLSSSDTTHSHKHKIKNQPKKINHRNKIVGSVLMEIGDVLMWNGFDGDRWWADGDQCWWSACNGLTEKRKEKDSKKKEGEEREAEIEIRIVWRRGYSDEKEGYWWSACDWLMEKRKEKDSQKKKKKKENKVEKKEGRR